MSAKSPRPDNMPNRVDGPQDQVLFIEHPLLKVPYEQLNRYYRGSQKTLEREVPGFKDVQGTSPKEQLQGLQEKLLAAREKVTGCAEKEKHIIGRIAHRAQLLKDHIENTRVSPPEDVGKSVLFEKKREDRLLVDYFLRAGYHETASQLAVDGNVEDLVDMEVFMEARRIEAALLENDLTPCLMWCNENKTKLKKIKSNLEFECRQLAYVELIRKEAYDAALAYASKHFSNVDDSVQSHVPTLMGLMVFGPDTKLSRYQEYLKEDAWSCLARKFRLDAYATHQLSGCSQLNAVLQAGLSALKTSHCYDSLLQSPNCPVCQHPFNDLAVRLPFKQTGSSTLICKMSGRPMTEPMMLPNCYVYDQTSLEAMALENGGEIVCPRTGFQCTLKELKRVFVI